MALPGEALSLGRFRGAMLQPDRVGRKGRVWDFERGGVGLNDPSLGRDYQDWQVRLVGNTVRLGPVGGTDVDVFIEANITELSVAFDQNMRPAIAYMAGGVAKLRWFDTSVGYEVTTSYPGARSPFLTLDDKRQGQNDTSDILFFYIESDNLYYRQQRDRYQTARLLLTGVGARASIHRVGMTSNLRLEIVLRDTVLDPGVFGWSDTVEQAGDTMLAYGEVLIDGAMAAVDSGDTIALDMSIIFGADMAVIEATTDRFDGLAHFTQTPTIGYLAAQELGSDVFAADDQNPLGLALLLADAPIINGPSGIDLLLEDPPVDVRFN